MREKACTLSCVAFYVIYAAQEVLQRENENRFSSPPPKKSNLFFHLELRT
jgi:hypothetical protein